MGEVNRAHGTETDMRRAASNPLCPKTERERDEALAALKRSREQAKHANNDRDYLAARFKRSEANAKALLTAARHLLDCSQASEPYEVEALRALEAAVARVEGTGL